MRAQDLRGFGPVGTNGQAESFDAVLAEMRDSDPMIPPFSTVTEWADRLQSAHARELAEQQATIEALRKDVAKEKSAANHWFSEANRDHNNLLRAEARTDAEEWDFDCPKAAAWEVMAKHWGYSSV